MERKKRGKPSAKQLIEEEENEIKINHKSFSDSDDEAANEDLTLKILEKAVAREKHAEVDVAGGEEEDVAVFVANGVVEVAKKKKKLKKAKKNKKKGKKVDPGNDVTPSVTLPTAEEDTIIDGEVVNVTKPDEVEKSNADNDVLRRLLRGPRYFDPPDKSWGACFNCGEEGHAAVNCTSARRKRPCFICGSLEHEVKQCQKGQDCFICKGQGHRAKDCPERLRRCSKASEMCLKCGTSAHAMFSCNNDYSPDDLKDIQCYVCKRFGHLCCVKYSNVLAAEASCYKCGETGHNGQDCRGSRGETSAGGTPSSCFRCGEEGHFARECKTSIKPKKRIRDSSTPAKKKYPKDNKGNRVHNSAPHDLGKTRKKKFQYDDGSPKRSSKSNRRGGWIPDESNRRGGWIPDESNRRGGWTQDESSRRGGWTQDDRDLPPKHGWRSPSTPNKQQHRIFDLSAGGHGSTPQSYNRRSNFSPGTSSSPGYGNGKPYQHRYTPSRFGSASNDGPRRNYDWW